MYDESLIQSMRAQLAVAGIREVRTAQDVDALLAEGHRSVFFFINSVCGCAARSARPGLLKALQETTQAPSAVATAFAGNDVGAVVRIRELFQGYPPSSPCGGLLRNGEHVFMVQRHQIEGRNPAEVAQQFVAGFKKYCGESVAEDVALKEVEGAGTYGKDRCFC